MVEDGLGATLEGQPVARDLLDADGRGLVVAGPAAAARARGLAAQRVPVHLPQDPPRRPVVELHRVDHAAPGVVADQRLLRHRVRPLRVVRRRGAGAPAGSGSLAGD